MWSNISACAFKFYRSTIISPAVPGCKSDCIKLTTTLVTYISVPERYAIVAGPLPTLLVDKFRVRHLKTLLSQIFSRAWMLKRFPGLISVFEGSSAKNSFGSSVKRFLSQFLNNLVSHLSSRGSKDNSSCLRSPRTQMPLWDGDSWREIF